jgi:LysR family glycine cleavage system transcriptional activator
MTRRIPPLNPLYTFEAAARHVSFTRAAHELHVTQGAISRQVRTLEKYLGVNLFERHHRSVRLTRAGKSFHDDLKNGFEQIEAAAERLIASRSQKTLVVRAYSTFGTRWLIPRLAVFREANPKIFVDFTASTTPVDFEREDVDIAVHFGPGEERNDLHRSLLIPVAITPVCSPALIRSRRPLRHPSDLQHYPLLHTLIRPDDWPNWLAANGIVADWASRGYRFESSSMAYEAALKEIGVAVAVTALVREELRDGRLITPFPMTVPTPYAYWLVYPPAKASNPAVTVFRNWILEEAKRFNKSL